MCAAVAYQLQNDLQRAEQLYQRALDLAPDAPQIWNNMGNLYRQHGDFAKAEEAYNQCLKLNPNSADVFNNLAVLHLKRGDIDGARRLLNRALAADPSFECASSNQNKLDGDGMILSDMAAAAPDMFMSPLPLPSTPSAL